MRCTSFCTAKKYTLQDIAKHYQSIRFKCKFFKDVLYINHPELHQEAFVFANGCCVLWGYTRRLELAFIENLKQFADNLHTKIYSDYFSIHPGDTTQAIPHEVLAVDFIYLETSHIQLKIALSYAIAQSIKLETYEELVQNAIEQNTYLSEEMANFGKISLSRSEISKRIGLILGAKISVNLYGDFLESPEYFWGYSAYEDHYLSLRRFLDINGRTSVLNQKLTVLNDMFELLNGHLQDRYTSFLEIIIIALIFIEVIMGLYQYHFS